MTSSPPSPAIDFRVLFESLPMPYLVLDPQLLIIAASEDFLRTTMARREDIIGCHVFDVFPDKPNNGDATGVRNLRESLDNVLKNHLPDTISLQQHAICTPGETYEERYWSSVSTPILNEENELLYIILCAEDATEFVRGHKSLKGKEYDIYRHSQEIEEANRKLHQANKEAENQRENLIERLMESNSELERFAYVASHDMQEPLRMIINFSQIIVQDYSDVLDAKGKEYLQLVADSGTRMRDMVDDLLEYAKLGHEAITSAQVDCALELGHVLENLGELIKDRGAVVTHGDLPVFHGNPVQFMRLLQNLIANAIKYQPAENVPKVHIEAQSRERDWCFLIQDNGIGIEEPFIKQVFEPFRRLHCWEAIKGSGLGLAVCKKIVDNHGGQIWVESVPAKGSIFYFTVSKQLAELPEAA
jgi:signal transduction histidine kinase